MRMRSIPLCLALASVMVAFGCGDSSEPGGGGDDGGTATGGTCPAPGEGSGSSLIEEFSACGGGEETGCSCVPQSTLEAMAGSIDMETLSQLANCDAMGTAMKCVPNEYVSNLAPCMSMTCESLQGAEGRCIKTCVPQVAMQEEMLPQGPCGMNEKCAPCYNPIDGEDTGACSVGPNDSPPDPSEAETFDECCQPEGASEPIGVCVPQDLVPEGSREMLPQDTCSDMEFCAPDRFARDSSANLETCTTSGDMTGGCVPKCFEQAGLEGIPPGSCGGGYGCVACSLLNSLAPERAPTECDTGGGDAGTGGGDAG